MKNFLFLLIVLISEVTYSQITEDFQATTPLVYFKLNNSETKYYRFDRDSNKLFLYNLNKSTYKIIQLPPNPNAVINYIDWISETLFDNDPSNIEFLIFYSGDSASYITSQARILRENGTILLDEINARSFFYDQFSYHRSLVFNTDEGPKLMLDYQWPHSGYYQTKVFSLPGQIPSGIQDNPFELTENFSLFPNPNKGSFSIKFSSKEGEVSVIDLFSPNGKLINSYKSSENTIHIDNPGLSDGLYFINVRSKDGNSSSKMIIKK